MLRATVFRAARSLREADVTLWPQGSQGSGQEAHVEASHLVNLALAIGVADPVTSAPKVVPFYRCLTSPTGHSVQLKNRDPFKDISESKEKYLGQVGVFLDEIIQKDSNLGSDLERLVDLLARNKRAAPALNAAYFRIEFVLDTAFPQVIASYSAPDAAPGAEGKRHISYLHEQRIKSGGRPLLRKVVLDTDLFACLGELWSHTKRYRTKTAIKRERKSLDPENSEAR